MESLTKIPISQIDDPARPMRLDLNEENLQDLAESIRQNGIIQPLLLRQKGERYEVIAGHRRLAAAWLAHLSEVPALVRDADDSKAAVLRVHENLVREDVDPVSEAVFIAQTCQELGWDAQRFAKEINRSVEYVQNRLEIASMPDYMQAALKDGKISIGVALALNEIDDERVRRDWTVSAINDGMTVSRAQNAVTEYFKLVTSYEKAGVPREEQEIPEAPPMILFACAACGKHAPLEELKAVRVHSQGCPAS